MYNTKRLQISYDYNLYGACMHAIGKKLDEIRNEKMSIRDQDDDLDHRF